VEAVLEEVAMLDLEAEEVAYLEEVRVVVEPMQEAKDLEAAIVARIQAVADMGTVALTLTELGEA
jgi:hypothetical protein